MTVVIIDNGGANTASIVHAFARLGAQATLTRDADRITQAERVVLPGVGAAGDGMRRLREAGIDETVRALRQPVLGICLGMQLLFDASDENDTECLGILPGKVRKLQPTKTSPVPHMGWNRISVRGCHPVLDGIGEQDWFYFVHGYAAPVNVATVASCDRDEIFAAVVGRNNFIAAQFHPELSANGGARFLANFLEWDGCS